MITKLNSLCLVCLQGVCPRFHKGVTFLFALRLRPHVANVRCCLARAHSIHGRPRWLQNWTHYCNSYCVETGSGKYCYRSAKTESDLWLKSEEAHINSRTCDGAYAKEVQGTTWKFARPFHGPFRVVSLTPTNADVRLIDEPRSDSMFVSLSRVRPCYGELPDASWRRSTPKRYIPK